MNGRRRYALTGERSWVLDRVSKAPDLTSRALAFKKVCAPANRIGPTWLAAALNGSVNKVRLTRPVCLIDEAWAKTNMTRTHGRCVRDTRLAQIRLRAPGAPSYVEEVLMSTLKPGDIVIIYNLGSPVRQAVRSDSGRGCSAA